MLTPKLLSGALLLSLSLLLTACTVQPCKPSTKLQMVETTKKEVVDLPAWMLEPCPVEALPEAGTSNLGLAGDSTRRYTAQVICNVRFEDIRKYLENARKEIEDGRDPPR